MKIWVLIIFLGLWAMPQASFGQARTLDEVWEHAKSRAPRLQLLKQQQTQLRGQTLQANALEDPTVFWDWEENPGKSPTSATNQKFGIKQDFPFPGIRGTRKAISAFDEKLLAREIDRQTLLLRRDVAKAFYTLVMRSNIVFHLQAAQKQVDNTLASTLLLYQGGKVSMADVLRLRLEASQLQNEIADEDQQRFEAESELRIICGLGNDYSLKMPTWSMNEPAGDSLEITRERLLKDSQLLVQQDILVDQAKAATRLSTLSYFPSLEVGAAYQRYDEAGVTEHGWAGEIGLTLPLWFWNRQRGQGLESEGLLRERQLRRDTVRRSLRTRIDQAYKQLGLRLDVQRRYQKTILKDAKDAVATGLTQYQNGRMTALELLDLLRTQRSASVAFERAVYETLVAHEQLTAIANEEMEL